MSTKSREQNWRAKVAAPGAAPPVGPDVTGPVPIGKTAKRKLQKKRAKLAAASAAALERGQAAAAKKQRSEARAAAAAAQASQPHPPPQPLSFHADEDDHCETSPQAYTHIAGLLTAIAQALGKEASALRIYDPYYCNGAVARHLHALGFPHVHNENEDFYAVLGAGRLPRFDVVVTNPPYSADHPSRLLEFCVASGRPWLALMPNWVSAREAAAVPQAIAAGCPWHHRFLGDKQEGFEKTI